MEGDRNRTVFVGNLDEQVTEDLFYELFLQVGPVDDVKIMKNKSYGFVTFKHECSVDYAVRIMSTTTLFGRYLSVAARTWRNNSLRNSNLSNNQNGITNLEHHAEDNYSLRGHNAAAQWTNDKYMQPKANKYGRHRSSKLDERRPHFKHVQDRDYGGIINITNDYKHTNDDRHKSRSRHHSHQSHSHRGLHRDRDYRGSRKSRKNRHRR